jgi:hypothetical protein
VKGLRDALALALATSQEADAVLASPQGSGPEGEVARQARSQDLPSYKEDVRRLLAQAVRGGAIFFRGTRFDLVSASSTALAVRETLTQPQLLPTIYSRLPDVPHRVTNEETAVKAALASNTGNADLQALGVYRADGTLNDSHPLLSTLRGRLPQAEKDGGLIAAADLRDDLERPPYGWDGNAVKVGLALLLRASACRLSESGKYITDPASPDAARLLTKDQSFKTLRVQGVGGVDDPAMLREVRDWVAALFGVKSSLVPATLHGDLGKALAGLGDRAGTLSEWAATAQCPLPARFAAGRQLAEDLAGTAAPAQRLRAFSEQAEKLQEYCTLLDGLEAFRRAQGTRFTEVRDYYNRMLNTGLEVPALRTFLEGWARIAREGSITEAARWTELEAVYRAAQQAIVERAAAWRRQVEEGLGELETRLARGLEEAGVPPEKMGDEQEALEPRLNTVRQRLSAPPTDATAMQAALTALQGLRLEVPTLLREVKKRYEPKTPDGEIRLSWQDILGSVRIVGAEDVDATLRKMRTSLERELQPGKTLVIE